MLNAEKKVHSRFTAGLGVVKVHDGNGHETNSSEDEIVSPRDLCHGNRGDFLNQECCEPFCGCGSGCTDVAHTQRSNLWGIYPRHGEPAEGECDLVDVHHGDAGVEQPVTV
jgi:hypothetical protein